MSFKTVCDPYGSKGKSPFVNPPSGIPGLMVTGAWSDKVFQKMRTDQLEALYLNYAQGWESGSYEFLKKLPWLKLLNINSVSVEELLVVSELEKLEYLSITSQTSSKIDLSKLQLVQCFLSWWPGAKSVFSCSSLESLYIDEIKDCDLPILKNLPNLKKLTLGNCNIRSLEKLEPLVGLQVLELLNCRQLEDISGIENLTKLSALAIRGSKRVYDFSQVSILKELEVLVLSDSGTIKSLDPVSGLNKLRAVSFTGASTKIEDGILSPLVGLPQLAMVNFTGHGHYSHRIIKPWNWDNFQISDNVLELK